jgi:hypothetical protein
MERRGVTDLSEGEGAVLVASADEERGQNQKTTHVINLLL